MPGGESPCIPEGESPCIPGDRLPDGDRNRFPKESIRRMLDRVDRRPAIESGVIVPDDPRTRLPDEPNLSPDEKGRRFDGPAPRLSGESGTPDGTCLTRPLPGGESTGGEPTGGDPTFPEGEPTGGDATLPEGEPTCDPYRLARLLNSVTRARILGSC